MQLRKGGLSEDEGKVRHRLDIFQTDHDDIEEVWEIFMLKFNKAEKEFIPKKVVKTGKRKFSYPLDKKLCLNEKRSTGFGKYI